jgi:hypothetical protein
LEKYSYDAGDGRFYSLNLDEFTAESDRTLPVDGKMITIEKPRNLIDESVTALLKKYFPSDDLCTAIE